MCFYIHTDIQKKVKVATEDIVCYKAVRPISEKTGNVIVSTKKTKYFKSIIFDNKKYTFGKIYNAKDLLGNDIKKFTIRDANTINEGFHAHQSNYVYGDNIQCIIPKGTKYFRNHYEIVAMKIKFVKWINTK